MGFESLRKLRPRYHGPSETAVNGRSSYLEIGISWFFARISRHTIFVVPQSQSFRNARTQDVRPKSGPHCRPCSSDYTAAGINAAPVDGDCSGFAFGLAGVGSISRSRFLVSGHGGGRGLPGQNGVVQASSTPLHPRQTPSHKKSHAAKAQPTQTAKAVPTRYRRRSPPGRNHNTNGAASSGSRSCGRQFASQVEAQREFSVQVGMQTDLSEEATNTPPAAQEQTAANVTDNAAERVQMSADTSEIVSQPVKPGYPHAGARDESAGIGHPAGDDWPRRIDPGPSRVERSADSGGSCAGSREAMAFQAALLRGQRRWRRSRRLP